MHIICYYPYYCISGNFRLEKIFAFFAQAHRGRKFFRRIILPSENFVTLKFSLVPRPREEGEKSSLVPIARACANYPKKTWGSEYDRIFSVFISSILP